MIEANLPEKCLSVNLVTIKNRFIFGFGLYRFDKVFCKNVENLFKLDTWNL